MADTPDFILKHKLWKGLFEHKGIGLMVLVISALFSYYLISDLLDSIQLLFAEPVVSQAMEMNLAGLPEIDEADKAQGKKDILSGGSKYLFLILLEVIIFYFSVKTLEILRDRKSNPGFKDFVKAEKRMIIVMGFNFIKGIIAQVFVYIILGIIGFNFLRTSAMFLVYSYFIGYAFLDNYNEQFGKSIKESQRIIRSHFGAALILGFLANILLYLPLVGPIVVPIVGGIAAAIYGERYKLEKIEI